MRTTCLILLMCIVGPALFGQDNRLAGSWQGNITPQIRLLFHFLTDSKGKLSATLDSPDQGAVGIACSEVIVKNDSVLVKIEVAKAAFSGKMVNDTTITGIWQQGAASLPLNFKKVVIAPETSRKQTPKPPFSYNAEDVEYDNADNSVHLGGTFTYPKGEGPFATVILITGSGQQDRDETIFNHKPFAVLADYLTRKGIAVLRVDDRGIGKSKGEILTATSADFANDVKASIEFIKSLPEVNKKQIGLIGHSEGGVIAPLAAAANSDVAFMVLWAAPMAGGLETNVAQNAHVLKNAGINPEAVKAFVQLHRTELESFKTVQDTTDLKVTIRKIFDDWRASQPDSILKMLYVTDQSIVGQKISSIYLNLYKLPWMRFFINHDFKADLAKFKGKVLAINGDKDTQVDAAVNLGIIDSVLQSNHNKNYKTVTLKGLNHLLQPAITGDVKEYGEIEETIDPSALELILNWIKENAVK